MVQRVELGFLAALASLIWLSGCAGMGTKFSGAVVGPTRIDNATTGFKGYHLSIPAGFTVLTNMAPIPGDSAYVAGCKTMFNQYRTHGFFYFEVERNQAAPKHDRIDCLEGFILCRENMAILFCVGDTESAKLRHGHSRPFSMITLQDQRTLLNVLAVNAGGQGELQMVGERMTARQGRPCPKSLRDLETRPGGVWYEELFVLGDLHETFEFAGLAARPEREALRQSVSELALGLKY